MELEQKKRRKQEEEHEYLKCYRDEILDKKGFYFVVMLGSILLNYTHAIVRGSLPTLEPAELIYRFRMASENSITIVVQAIFVYYVRHKTFKVLDYLCEGSIVFFCALTVLMNLATMSMQKQKKT
jgi:hypothetical protein